MELALNLAWLIVAGGMFVVFGVSAVRLPAGSSSRRRRLTMFVALACVAVLLFPIISMSDDLATAPAAVEVWRAMRRSTHFALFFVAALPLIPAISVSAAVAQVGRSTHLACAGLVFISALAVLSPSFSTVWSFRAPPVASL